MKTAEEQTLGMFFPKDTFVWFDITESSVDESNIRITLQEKNLPPIPDNYSNQPIEAKGFTDITITDFPIRGRRTLLTFRRRYWQIEGQTGYLKRDIKLSFPGTQLETEFALFLKEDGGRQSGLADFYRKVSLPPDQGV